MSVRKALPAILVIILLISGCVDSGKTKTASTGRDLLVLGDIEIYPGKVLDPGSSIILRTDVSNVGTEPAFLLVDNVDPDNLYDGTGKLTGNGVLLEHKQELYTFKEFTMMPFMDCAKPKDLKEYGEKARSDAEEHCYIQLEPSSSMAFQWKLTAPSAEDILHLTDETTFRFQAKYLGVAKTNTYIYFSSPTEIGQKSYTRDDLALSGPNIATEGPITMNFQTLELQPISSKKGQSWTLYLESNNKGKGLAKMTSVRLDLPDDPNPDNNEEKLFRKDEGRCKYFNDPVSYTDDGVTSENVIVADEGTTKEMGLLQIYGGKSSKLSCTLTTPENVVILTPYRFTTTAHYSYSLFDTLKVETKPKK